MGKSLISVFPDNFITDGIFTKLDELNVPWKGTVSKESLNIDYYGNRSGNKNISLMIERILGNRDKLSNDEINIIAKMLKEKYSLSWKNAWDAMIAEYNPIHNYDRKENETIVETKEGTKNATDNVSGTNTGTITKEGTDTGSTTTSKSGSDTLTNKGTESNSGSSNNTDDNNNSIYGFNSVSGVNSDNSHSTNTGTDSNTLSIDTENKTTYNSTNTENKNNSNTETQTNNLQNTETRENSETTNDNNNITRQLNVSGNIGVSTSQQMIESELKLRFNWNYFELVYKDIDRELISSFDVNVLTL